MDSKVGAGGGRSCENLSRLHHRETGHQHKRLRSRVRRTIAPTNRASLGKEGFLHRQVSTKTTFERRTSQPRSTGSDRGSIECRREIQKGTHRLFTVAQTAAIMKNTTEIPTFLSHLKTYTGYPVPFVQMYIDGKPDFRVIDPERSDECLHDKLCAICGRRLGEFCYFIGGALCRENHLFADAPMHEQCADFASKTCPFVSGKKLEYSTRP